MSTIGIGSTVQWTSQSAGTVRAKRGMVIEVVPAGVRPDVRGAGMARDHESYVVQVGGRRYWPRVNLLTDVTPRRP